MKKVTNTTKSQLDCVSNLLITRSLLFKQFWQDFFEARDYSHPIVHYFYQQVALRAKT
jgi:hypothetical protein